MKYTRTGKIADNFHVVENAEYFVCLMDGPVPALFDAGLTALCLKYEEGLLKILGNRAPGYLFLTHYRGQNL